MPNRYKQTRKPRVGATPRVTDRLKTIRAKIKHLGLTEKAVKEAIRSVRASGRRS